MNDADHRALAEAFYRAESLAHTALNRALEQVAQDYHRELREQIADEERHVAVFARWLGPDREAVVPPRPKTRPDFAWFTTLLLNECAGFCQFHMLAGLVGDAVREAEVLEVARDETVHIRRLVRWLEPAAATRAVAIMESMTRRFSNRLEGRMCQFLPRDELDGLRVSMAQVTAQLIADAVPKDSR